MLKSRRTFARPPDPPLRRLKLFKGDSEIDAVMKDIVGNLRFHLLEC